MTDQQEVEWQFDAPDVRSVVRWLENRERQRISITAGETRELSDTYLDTDDWRIYRAGYALRVRCTEGRSRAEATMKLLASEGGSPGFRSRREISETLESAAPNALKDASGPVAERVRALSGPRPLRPLFEVKTRRSTYGLALDGVEVGEVALDETTIPQADGVDPAGLRRVEVEVEPESVSRLESFVERLRDECKLTPAAASKYETGILARGISLPEPPEFGPTAVDDSISTGELAFRVLREQFCLFLAHEPGTRIGEEPEELHDMRVATRRMRAAMKIFEKAVPARTQEFRDEFKWVAGALGEVRDLDVQLEHLRGWTLSAAPQDRKTLELLRAVLEEQREKKRKAMLRTLNSRRYAHLIESFGEFLRSGPSRRARASRQPILGAAPDLIRKPYRKVRKLGDPLTKESSSEEYHELRKKGKHLRYALEFHAEIYGKPAEDLIKSLKKLQNLLGGHQDAVVASSYLRGLSAAKGNGLELPPETIFVMGSIAHRYGERARELRKRFPGVYRGITGKRWKKLRGAMEKARPRELDRQG